MMFRLRCESVERKYFNMTSRHRISEFCEVLHGTREIASGDFKADSGIGVQTSLMYGITWRLTETER